MTNIRHNRTTHNLHDAFRLRGVILLAGLLLFSLPMAAQNANEGVDHGNYNIKQAFEFGYRFTDFSGNMSTFNTFVYMREGPRLLEHRLEMRSLNHEGWLFDDFSLHSFGYGGDPNNVTRLRAYKNRWYNFNGTFRLNRNAWDYNLLANPLNPVTSNPSFPIDFSLHKMELVRRMTDLSLTLMPQSPLRLRLGYGRNIVEGPSFTTPRAGTETVVLQNWKTTVNQYTIGVDFKFIPRTNISYDQFLHYFKGDTTWVDTIGEMQFGLPRIFAQLSNGTPVDLGFMWNTAASQPCAAPISSTATTPPTANAACNGFLDYALAGNTRSSYPTEQISFQSTYFKDLDLSGRFSYSSADVDFLDYGETFDGRLSRTNARSYAIAGNGTGKRVSVTADLAATWYATEKLRFVNSFRFHDFRIPTVLDTGTLNFFGATMLVTPNVFTPGPAPPANCNVLVSPAVTTGCPAHNTSSPADVISSQAVNYLGEEYKFNQIEAVYDFSRRFGGRIGYRIRARDITLRHGDFSDNLYFPTLPNRGDPVSANRSLLVCGSGPLAADGSCFRSFASVGEEAEEITEHTALLGLWVRPHRQFRMSFDLQLLSADHAFTRISPRQQQNYKLRGTYQPSDWATINGSMNIMESRNNVAEIFHQQHYRTFGFGVTLAPRSVWSLDFGYDYTDIFSQTNICFTLTGTPLPPGSSPCPQSVPAATTQALSFYDNGIHFFYFDAMWNPVRRLRTFLGYTVTSTSGDTLILAPAAPLGTLAYNYHLPRAGLEFDFGQGFTGRAFWNHYGYNEKGPADPTAAARDFRGNMFTLSVRYGF